MPWARRVDSLGMEGDALGMEGGFPGHGGGCPLLDMIVLED